MEQRSFTTDITRCARCGMNHEGVTVRAFTSPPTNATHFVMCPTLDEPILLTTRREAPEPED